MAARQGGEGMARRIGPGAGKRAGGERAGEEFSGPRREKKKGRMGWAERVRGKKKRFSIFQNDSNTSKLNSNSKI